MSKRVVITGLGVVAPNGTGSEQFLHSLKNGISGIRFIEELKELGFGCQIGGVPDISQSSFLPAIEKYGYTDASDVIRLAIAAGLEAWIDAGLEIPDRFESDPDYESGCIIGSGIGTADIFGNKIIPHTNEKNIRRLRSTIVEHSMLSGPSAALTAILGLGNQNTFNSSACSTGAESVIMAFDRIASGKADRMLAGGTDAFSPYGWAGFDAMRVLTRKHNDEPEKGSRPLSASASGFAPGAGAGILLIESLESASKRNARIYAEILSGEINSGGQRQSGTMTAPNPHAVIRCIHSAIKSANIEAGQIDFISGHLSSTMADVIEIKNWVKALGLPKQDFPYINSCKSMTGHCIGAAGGIEIVAAIMQLYHGFVHPSLNSEDLHPEISDIIDREKIPLQLIENADIKYVAKASFGFGDVNTCLILGKL
ncbi:MAG: beta-ketoacyl-[acyl-carrier-protein] synthase family protein [Bacteroidetes bacterium]|nr:beta-ketoacyl-[acyl-carrier-protein] synthase family protein [Bacteroidota bacterium]MBU1719578.1 beta-ketoacyl-[acyl-carrier-protein] synthase family protein [Bacteroidota bacterium]